MSSCCKDFSPAVRVVQVVPAVASAAVLAVPDRRQLTKAYLSGPAARYAQGGIPTLADIINSLAPAGGAAVPALAGSMQGP